MVETKSLLPWQIQSPFYYDRHSPLNIKHGRDKVPFCMEETNVPFTMVETAFKMAETIPLALHEQNTF